MKKVTYEEVAGVLDRIIQEAGQALLDVELVVGVSRGGLFPAMVVSTTLVKPLIVAYIDQQDNVYFDRAKWIRSKKVLLVDDIVRSGKTVRKIKRLLLKKGASSVKTFAPYCLRKAKCHAPDYGRITRADVMFPWDE